MCGMPPMERIGGIVSVSYTPFVLVVCLFLLLLPLLRQLIIVRKITAVAVGFAAVLRIGESGSYRTTHIGILAIFWHTNPSLIALVLVMEHCPPLLLG